MTSKLKGRYLLNASLRPLMSSKDPILTSSRQSFVYLRRISLTLSSVRSRVLRISLKLFNGSYLEFFGVKGMLELSVTAEQSNESVLDLFTLDTSTTGGSSVILILVKLDLGFFFLFLFKNY